MINTVVKISSPHCPFCAHMSRYDRQILLYKGYGLEEVESSTIETHPRLLQLLLNAVEGELSLPTYVHLESRKVLEGGFSEKEFSRKVETILPEARVGEGFPFPLTKKRLELEVWSSERGALPLPLPLPLDFLFPRRKELRVGSEEFTLHRLSDAIDREGKFSLCTKKEND